jgi:hypothetical protein
MFLCGAFIVHSTILANLCFSVVMCVYVCVCVCVRVGVDRVVGVEEGVRPLRVDDYLRLN